MKKQAGLGPVMTVVLVALMVGMGCWAMQVAKISFMPLCISLTTALLLPELWHSLKDFSYFSSAKVAAFILALSALSGLTVIPLWKDRSEVNLIPAVVMIILVAAATSGFSLLVGMADWINKKAKT